MINISVEQNGFIFITLTYLFAIICPGPSLFLVIKNSLLFTGKQGIYTALGTISGIACQSFCIILFMTYLQQDHVLFFIIKIICTLYIFYLVYTTHFSRDSYKNEEKKKHDSYINNNNAFFQGFLLDILNPGALSFFLCIFSLYVLPETPIGHKLLLWVWLLLLGALWYVGCSFLLHKKSITNSIFVFLKEKLNKIFSLFLIYIVIKLWIK